MEGCEQRQVRQHRVRSRLYPYRKQWKKASQEPASPKKDRGGRSTAKAVGAEAQEKEAEQPKLEKKQSYQRQDSSKERRTFNVFNTELKKEISKDREFFAPFNSISSVKKVNSKTERKDGSVLADIENNLNLKIHELDGTNSESLNPINSSSNRNSTSLQASPDPVKRLDMFQQEMPLNDMQ